jgi:hypothetical protein
MSWIEGDGLSPAGAESKNVIATVHESEDGTNRTNPADLTISAARGNPEVAVRSRQDRF